jgi:hypothetical protein
VSFALEAGVVPSYPVVGHPIAGAQDGYGCDRYGQHADYEVGVSFRYEDILV